MSKLQFIPGYMASCCFQKHQQLKRHANQGNQVETKGYIYLPNMGHKTAQERATAIPSIPYTWRRWISHTHWCLGLPKNSVQSTWAINRFLPSADLSYTHFFLLSKANNEPLIAFEQGTITECLSQTRVIPGAPNEPNQPKAVKLKAFLSTLRCLKSV